MSIRRAVNRGQRPYLAGLWLVAAIPAAMLVLYPLDRFTGLQISDSAAPFAIGLFHFAAGYLWARALARRSGIRRSRWLHAAGGLGYGVSFIGGYFLVVAVDPDLSKWRLPIALTQPLDYLTVFAAWFAIVAGISGMALGLGLGDPGTAFKLLGVGIIVGPVTLFVVSLPLGLAGFEVGGNHPPRPTMLPVTLLAAWITALVGSEVFGRVLSRTRRAQGAMIESSQQNPLAD